MSKVIKRKWNGKVKEKVESRDRIEKGNEKVERKRNVKEEWETRVSKLWTKINRNRLTSIEKIEKNSGIRKYERKNKTSRVQSERELYVKCEEGNE